MSAKELEGESWSLSIHPLTTNIIENETVLAFLSKKRCYLLDDLLLKRKIFTIDNQRGTYELRII